MIGSYFDRLLPASIVLVLDIGLGLAFCLNIMYANIRWCIASRRTISLAASKDSRPHFLREYSPDGSTHLDGRPTPCLDDEQSQEFGRQFDRIVIVSLLGMMQPEALPREARRDRRRGGRRTTTMAFPPRAAVPPVVGRRA